jgi:DNA-binding transcriptional regulator of glucitol operon
MVKRLLTPRWIAFTLFVVAAVVAMVALGWWQWQRYEAIGGSLQNLAYTVQWPLFAAFAVYLWWRLLRDAVKGDAEPETPPAKPEDELPPLPPKVVTRSIPLLAAPEPADEELASYNRYLSELNEQDR